MQNIVLLTLTVGGINKHVEKFPPVAWVNKPIFGADYFAIIVNCGTRKHFACNLLIVTLKTCVRILVLVDLNINYLQRSCTTADLINLPAIIGGPGRITVNLSS